MAKTIKYNLAFTIKFKGYKRHEWIKDLLIVYWPKNVKQRLKKTNLKKYYIVYSFTFLFAFYQIKEFVGNYFNKKEAFV